MSKFRQKFCSKRNIVFMMSLLFVISCLSFSLVSATSGGFHSSQGAEYFSNGYALNVLIQDEYYVGQDSVVYFTPYELSGKTIAFNDLNVVCRIGFVSPDGFDVIVYSNENMTGFDDIWVVYVNGSFFSEEGLYLFNVDCQGNTFGGYHNGEIEVSSMLYEDGEDTRWNPFYLDLDSTKGIIILVLIIGMGILFFFIKQFKFSGLTFMFVFFLLLYNGINFFVSGISLAVGILLVLGGKKG